ncbi:sensor histidine kinase [Azospirillum thermophilum]|uniref:histidine kinase n=1 Tax=Azospirillum thermophilum TaxID=2202148 RepID=A0A2S2CZG4_9PROT|nr:histidine kinase N-terminal 7TM domain-containing protein [Azospirillum thermophilum]AWK89896.1 PAS domain-containing sensor histidine kinase [Azospirillum thermophilum]
MLNFPAILLLATVLVTLWTTYRSLRQPRFPGRGDFVAMQLAAVWWSTAAAIENIVPTPDAKVFWAEMAWFGIVPGPSFWALFIWSYIHGHLSPLWRPPPLAMGLVTGILALTNDSHGLLYVDTRPISAEPGAAIVYEHGLWFYLTTVYLYLFMVVAIAVTANGIVRAPRVYRSHYLGFLLVMAVPWIANISYITGNVTLFDFDPTPFGFLAMGCTFYWLITRRQLFDLVPVARGALLDAVPDPVLVTDAEGTVVEANRAARALAADGIVGQRLAATPLGDALGDRPPLAGEAPRVVALGTEGRYFEVKRETLHYADRRVGQLLLLRDITHLKRAEARLEETIRSLDAARLQAERLLAAEQSARRELHQFLGMAAHEFKTPLAIIDSAAQMMLLKAEQGAPDFIHRLRTIRSAVRRQVITIETCLADERLNNASFSLRLVPVDLEGLLFELVAEQMEDGAADGRDHRIELEIDRPERCGLAPDVLGDAELLDLCIRNLLSNAVKYSPKGSRVLIRARFPAGPGGLATVSVVDSGIGIPPDEIDLVFERYVRASNATASGSGVGLNIVRRIVQLHGGTVRAESELGKGSSFTIALPLAPRRSENGRPQPL